MTNDTDIAPIGLLAGTVVFITGASRGIGAAAARLFAREHLPAYGAMKRAAGWPSPARSPRRPRGC
jgi:NAD(P)-dependent dehydrogenase (short-subunit alcohol dehydrogenase family)